MRQVIAVQADKDAANSSDGLKPVSVPPCYLGSSATNEWPCAVSLVV
ncbi:MAG: hypothetical protein PSX81_13105 [bacterium]|nr:hypothetical protein [bacterium]